MLKVHGNSIFKRYILTYMLAVLFAVVSIGVIFMSQYTNRLTRQLEQEWSSQLEVVSNDVSKNLKSLVNESSWLTTQEVFSKFAYNPTAYNTMLLKENMYLMKGHMLIDIDMACYREGKDVVYSDKGVSTVNTYLSKFGTNAQGKNILELAREQKKMTYVHWKDEEGKGSLVLIYPCSMLVNNKTYSSITLIYAITHESIWNRTNQLVGTLPGDIALYFDHTLLFGNDRETLEEENGVYTFDENTLFVKNVQDTSLQLVMRVPKNRFLEEISPVYNACLTSIIAICLLGMIMSVIFAWRSFTPILELKNHASEINDGDVETEGNEIDYITKVMTNNHQSGLTMKSLLADQKQAIRQQVLELLIRGDSGVAVREMMTRSDLKFQYPLLSVLVITAEKDDHPRRDLQQLADRVSDLAIAGSNVISFFSSLVEQGIVIIASFAKKEAFDELTTAVEQHAQAILPSFRLGKGSITDEMDQLFVSFSDALYATEIHSAEIMFEGDGNEDFGNWYNNEKIHLVQLLKAGNVIKASESAGNLVNRICTECQSSIMCKLMCNDLLNCIVKAAISGNITIEEQILNNCLHYRNISDFKTNVQELAENISGIFSDRIINDSLRNAQSILEYIQNHATDYDISLQKLSEEFDLSFNQINNIMKESTGHTFRELVITYRLNEAQRLLTETDKSIAEISATVGYNNVSHFIKQFKSTFNVTPSQYRDHGKEPLKGKEQ